MRTEGVAYEPFSGWVDAPTDLRPAVHGDLTCQVAVVGGGIGGMSTALRLAERGQDVVLVEAEFCGHGSSSRNAGQLAGAPGGDLQLLNLLSRRKMPGMMRLAENAAHHVEDFIAEHDIDCEYEATGNAFVAVSRGQMARVRRVAKIVTRADAIVEGERHADLETLWQEKPRFPRPMMMGRTGLRTIWAVDRFNDMVNGSRRNACRATRRSV